MVNLPFILGIDAFSRALFVQRTPSIIVWPQCYTLPFFSVFGLLCNSMPIFISQSLITFVNQYRNPYIRFLKHIWPQILKFCPAEYSRNLNFVILEHVDFSQFIGTLILTVNATFDDHKNSFYFI